ncbi:hypothetical protein TNCV_3025211 [Trichonephila clavipes]|nr:hypothetical protein TNCV_3025211 [Trichonephila clavipes]
MSHLLSSDGQFGAFIFHILIPFVATLIEEEKNLQFQQDGATAHTFLLHRFTFTQSSLLTFVSRGQSGIEPSWLAMPPDLFVCGYFMWGYPQV